MTTPAPTGVPVLVAEDDPAQRLLLVRLLERGGYRPVPVRSGLEARAVLESRDHPMLCLLDWNMPGISGLELCRWLRSRPDLEGLQVILVTARDTSEDVLEALQAGADDHVAKPYRQGELLARLAASARVAALQGKLDAKILELESALAEITQLRGLLPICAHCHRIRDNQQQWRRLEAYFEERADVSFSHSICDECLEKHYPQTPSTSEPPRVES